MLSKGNNLNIVPNDSMGLMLCNIVREKSSYHHFLTEMYSNIGRLCYGKRRI